MVSLNFIVKYNNRVNAEFIDDCLKYLTDTRNKLNNSLEKLKVYFGKSSINET